MATAPAGPALAVGCDVVDVARIADKAERVAGFRERVFTPRELADCVRGGVRPGSATEHARLAARFAAKEATRKALGDLGLGFHETEVRSGADGAPLLYVRGEPAAMHLSLSHDGGVAMAVVVGWSDRGRGRLPSRSDAARRPF